MPLNRRNLLKKGALAGALTAGAAALGIANAPAAQAAGGYDTMLTNLYNTYGLDIFAWSEAVPHVTIQTDPGQWYPDYEIWRKDRCTKEGGFIYYDLYNWPYPYCSDNWRNYQISSVGLIQIMLNKLVQYGQLGGSYIGTDSVFGQQTAWKVADFQTRYGLSASGTVGSTTWNRLRDKAIYGV